MNNIDNNKVIIDLFKSALTNGGIDYIYTLVRVDGMTCNIKDPLLTFIEKLKIDTISYTNGELHSMYLSPQLLITPFSLIANLLNCSVGGNYEVSPFHELYKGKFPNSEPPSPQEISTYITQKADKAGKHVLVDAIRKILYDVSYGINNQTFRENILLYKSFFDSFFKIYSNELRNCIGQPKYYKLPQFEVLELLTNDKTGLYGFIVHFSNGESAKFARYENSTECINIILQTPINFDVGLLGKLRNVWMVGNKKLFEIGIPGRYNKLGEWKPLIYPGDFKSIIEEAKSFSENEEIQSIIFYIMCTAYWGFEFVVKTNIDFQSENFSLGNKIHLTKCQDIEKKQIANKSYIIYDGWYKLDKIDEVSIETALNTLNVGMNRMAFAYEASLKWKLKYSLTDHSIGLASPNEDDLQILDSLLIKFPKTEDSYQIDFAIDWYNRGTNSKNIFVKFLCYFISIESLAIPLANGEISLGLSIKRKSTRQKKQEKIKCIENKYKELYNKNPIEFIKKAYSECESSIKKKLSLILENVFGSNHNYIDILVNNKNHPSLYDIRSKIAHGSINNLDHEDKILVESNIHYMKDIAKNFLLRIIFSLKPEEKIPNWSGRHQINLDFADPRSTGICTRKDIFPNNDWRIKPEWCE